MRGRKPKPRHLRIIGGNAGHRPIPPEVEVDIAFDNHLEPPHKLGTRQRAIWDLYIRRLPWLQFTDAPIAALWCELQVEAERSPRTMLVGRIAQWRALAGELGLCPAGRTRLAGEGAAVSRSQDLAAKYLDGKK